MKYNKEAKPGAPDKGSRVLQLSVLFFVLCGFSFYLGGIFCSEKTRFETNDVKQIAVPSAKESMAAPLQIKAVSFPECSPDYQDYTPCTDPRVCPYHWISGSAGLCVIFEILDVVQILMTVIYVYCTEVEKVWPSSPHLHGTPLPSNIWKERMPSSTSRWIQVSNQVAK